MTGSSPGSDLKATGSPRATSLTRHANALLLKRYLNVDTGNKNRTPKPYLKVFSLESTCALILSAFIRETRLGRIMRTLKPVLSLAR